MADVLYTHQRWSSLSTRLYTPRQSAQDGDLARTAKCTTPVAVLRTPECGDIAHRHLPIHVARQDVADALPSLPHAAFAKQR